jgi:hypothetical protein
MMRQELAIDGSRGTRLGTTLSPGAIAETVTVVSGLAELSVSSRQIQELARKNQQGLLNTPSQNVLNLQRRVAGVLPVHVDVPRSGRSYRFVRPLVLDEETKITFQYKSK